MVNFDKVVEYTQDILDSISDKTLNDWKDFIAKYKDKEINYSSFDIREWYPRAINIWEYYNTPQTQFTTFPQNCDQYPMYELHYPPEETIEKLLKLRRIDINYMYDLEGYLGYSAPIFILDIVNKLLLAKKIIKANTMLPETPDKDRNFLLIMLYAANVTTIDFLFDLYLSVRFIESLRVFGIEDSLKEYSTFIGGQPETLPRLGVHDNRIKANVPLPLELPVQTNLDELTTKLRIYIKKYLKVSGEFGKYENDITESDFPRIQFLKALVDLIKQNNLVYPFEAYDKSNLDSLELAINGTQIFVKASKLERQTILNFNEYFNQLTSLNDEIALKKLLADALQITDNKPFDKLSLISQVKNLISRDFIDLDSTEFACPIFKGLVFLLLLVTNINNFKRMLEDTRDYKFKNTNVNYETKVLKLYILGQFALGLTNTIVTTLNEYLYKEANYLLLTTAQFSTPTNVTKLTNYGGDQSIIQPDENSIPSSMYDSEFQDEGELLSTFYHERKEPIAEYVEGLFGIESAIDEAYKSEPELQLLKNEATKLGSYIEFIITEKLSNLGFLFKRKKLIFSPIDFDYLLDWIITAPYLATIENRDGCLVFLSNFIQSGCRKEIEKEFDIKAMQQKLKDNTNKFIHDIKRELIEAKDPNLKLEEIKERAERIIGIYSNKIDLVKAKLIEIN